jgi:REP-associated tyrosine transposase
VARPPRLLAAGAFYHLTCRGVRKLPIYETDRDRTLFLALLRLTLKRFQWRCHTYCLMPNHFHLLAETIEPNLSSGMHWLNTAYARIFNTRHGYSGHLFDRRFYSGLVEGGVQFATHAATSTSIQCEPAAAPTRQIGRGAATGSPSVWHGVRS